MSGREKYKLHSMNAFCGPDGRHYRMANAHVEVLNRRTGNWQLLRTASQPFIDSLRLGIAKK